MNSGFIDAIVFYPYFDNISDIGHPLVLHIDILQKQEFLVNKQSNDEILTLLSSSPNTFRSVSMTPHGKNRPCLMTTVPLGQHAMTVDFYAQWRTLLSILPSKTNRTGNTNVLHASIFLTKSLVILSNCHFVPSI